MKKALSILLVAILVMGTLPFALAAENAAGDIVVEKDAWVSSLAMLGEKMYAAMDGKLVEIDPATREIKTYEMKTDHEELQDMPALAASKDALYAVFSRREKLQVAKIVLGEGTATYDQVLTPDVEEFLYTQVEGDGKEEHYLNLGDSSVVQDGRLFLLFRKEGAGDEMALASFDLETGNKEVYEVPDLVAVAAGKDGYVHVLTMANEDRGVDDKFPALQRLTVADGKLEEIGSVKYRPYHAGFFIYDAAGDSFYYNNGGGVYRCKSDGVEELCAYLPMNHIWSGSENRVLLHNGYIYYLNNGIIVVRSTDPSKLPQEKLTMYGYGGYDAVEKALQAVPEVQMKRLEDVWFSDAKELGQALVSGENAIDLLGITEDLERNTLYEKGYLMDLSQSELIKAYMDKLYPQIREACMKDGKIYAVPVGIRFRGMGYSDVNLKKANEKKPETLLEFFELAERVLKNEELLQTCNFSEDSEGWWVTEMLFTVYQDHFRRLGKEMTLDTPLFREALQKALDVRKLLEQQEKPDWNDQAALDAFFSKPQLFGEIMDIDMEAYTHRQKRPDSENEWYKTPLNLVAEQGEEPYIHAELELIGVNAKAVNQTTAVRFLEAMINALREPLKIAMCMEENEPVLNKDLKRQKGYMEKSVKDLTAMIEKAEGAEKTNLEKSLETVKKELENFEELNKYKISAEAIAWYRDTVKNMYVNSAADRVLTSNEDLLKVMERLLDGQLDVEGYIREADAKLRLIQKEKQ